MKLNAKEGIEYLSTNIKIQEIIGEINRIINPIDIVMVEKTLIEVIIKT